MKILVTGANGFVGKNLVAELKNQGYKDILSFTRETDISLLDDYAMECDFVFHLAGVNRPKDQKEFIEGNVNFTSQLLNLLKKHQNKSPILFTSSIQAEQDNQYGLSKKSAEDLLIKYGNETGAKTLIYRLPNLFGKWCKPNYNSVIATFCHNIARGLPIKINDPNAEMNLVYIDDLLNEFIEALHGKENRKSDYCEVEPVHKIKLGSIAEMIQSFKNSRENLSIANMSDPITKKLYSTYLSYLPQDQFSYPLKMNVDDRGSFSEFIKTADRGQVSVNVSKPGITKGNHWHHTKNEKFLVVSGEGVIQFRKLDSDDTIEYRVSGDKLEVVDIPVGYTHNIINLGESDMVTVMWVNEIYDPSNPDTYFLEV